MASSGVAALRTQIAELEAELTEARRLRAEEFGRQRVRMDKKNREILDLRAEVRSKSEALNRAQFKLGEGVRLSERVREQKSRIDRDRRLIKKLQTPTPLSAVQEELRTLVVGYGEQRIFPEEVVKAAVEIVTDRDMSHTLEALMERRSEIGSDEKMLLIGIGMNPQARRHFDDMLDKLWLRDTLPLTVGMPVVIGSGVHGAIAASVLHKKRGFKAIVLEMKDRVGGAFGVTRGPSFYLNSRNRPGPLSIPGDEFGALNVLPGAPIQPSDVSADEYLSNDQVAWVVRCMLLMHANVYAGVGEVAVRTLSENPRFNLSENSTNYYPSDLVIATGLSKPNIAFVGMEADERYLTYEQFLKRFDGPYPLKGMRRVAVLGAGDGGKTVVEALIGQGPTANMSIPTLDYPELIDWFGVPNDRRTRQEWEACNRSRYKGIGRAFGGRLQAFDKPSYVEPGYDTLKVNGVPYDFVVDCTGYVASVWEAYDAKRDPMGGAILGRTGSNRTAIVGPAAKIPNERMDETILKGIPENATSIFRYADKTARFAEVLQ